MGDVAAIENIRQFERLADRMSAIQQIENLRYEELRRRARLNS
jgi:hypothetical protein